VPTPDPSAEIEWDEEKDTKGAQFKNEGVELMGSDDYPGAVTKLTEALKFCAHKAPFWAFRAAAYLKWKKPLCAIKDATVALKFNPENAKALRTRGQANRYLGNYEQANLDLNAANRVDYDDLTLEMIKFVDARAAKIQAKKRREDMAKEEAAQGEARRRQRPRLAVLPRRRRKTTTKVWAAWCKWKQSQKKPTVAEMVAAGYGVSKLRSAGVSCADIRAAGFSIEEMRKHPGPSRLIEADGGFQLEDFCRAHFPLKEIMGGLLQHFSINEVLDAFSGHYTLRYLIECNTVQALRATGRFTTAEFYQLGVIFRL